MKKIYGVLILILLLALAAGGFYAYRNYQARHKVTADALQARLENASELTTQKMIYNGVIESESGGVPILTKETFLMTYKATVRAGFDVSKTAIDVAEDKVTVTLPEMEIQEVTIDPDEIKTYTTSLTLIKPDGKAELKEALVMAEEDAKKKADEEGLLEAADANAETLVKNLFADAVGERELVVKHK